MKFALCALAVVGLLFFCCCAGNAATCENGVCLVAQTQTSAGLTLDVPVTALVVADAGPAPGPVMEVHAPVIQPTTCQSCAAARTGPVRTLLRAGLVRRVLKAPFALFRRRC